MGEIADSMINGELCEECGVYLEPLEIVYSSESTHHEGSLSSACFTLFFDK